MKELIISPLFSDANLQAYYRFNTGALTTDTKGANTLTNNDSVGEAAGKFGIAADFGANNVNKSLSRNADLGITGGACTFSAWIKLLTEIGSGVYGVVSQQDGGNKVTMGIYYEYNGGARRLMFDRTKNYVANDRSYYTIALGTSLWHHVAFTYDGTNIRGFYNGELVAGPTASSGNGTTNGTDKFAIGASIANATGTIQSWFSGLIDDVAVFNRALSPVEINSIFKASSSGMFLVF